MPRLMVDKFAGEMDGSIRARTMTFLLKLAEDDTTPGLHIEPIRGSADSRVRTGRVDRFWRAVLFRIEHDDGECTYLFRGVWPHDEAIRIAQNARLTVNPVNGLPQLESTPEAVEPTPQQRRPDEAHGSRTFLVAQGFTVEDLTGRLGLPTRVARAALD